MVLPVPLPPLAVVVFLLVFDVGVGVVGPCCTLPIENKMIKQVPMYTKIKLSVHVLCCYIKLHLYVAVV